MPLISPATLRGISSCLRGIPVRAAMLIATGMKMATTPVELMIDPSKATESISRTMSRAVLAPARRASQSPSL